MHPPSQDVLSRWLSSLADDGVDINPQDINAEAIANLRCFSPNDEETLLLDVVGVQRFVEAGLARRRRWLAARQAPPMRFYAWHDAQARQLRMSAVSSSHGRLPFRCAVVETPDLEAVVREIVEGDWQNPGYGTDPLDSLPDADPPPFALRVFVAEMRDPLALPEGGKPGSH